MHKNKYFNLIFILLQLLNNMYTKQVKIYFMKLIQVDKMNKLYSF